MCVEYAAEVNHLTMCGGPLFECAKTVVLCDAETKPLHGNIDTDALRSGLGPGDALTTHFQHGPPTLVAFGVGFSRL